MVKTNGTEKAPYFMGSSAKVHILLAKKVEVITVETQSLLEAFHFCKSHKGPIWSSCF